MAIAKFLKGTYAAYTRDKETLKANGSIYICTDEPLLCAWGKEIGLSNANKQKLDDLYDALLGEGEELKSVAEQIEEAISELIGDSEYESFDDIQDAIEAVVTQIEGLNYSTASNGIITAVTQTEGQISATSIAVGNGLEISAEKLQVKLDAANKILSNSANGIAATLSLGFASSATLTESNNAVIQLKGVDGEVISELDAEAFLMDRVLGDVQLEGNTLTFSFKIEHGGEESIEDIEVDLSKYITVYTEGNGIKINNNAISVEVKEGEKFLEATATGLATKGLDVLDEKASSTETAGKVLTQTTEGPKWQPTTIIKKGEEVITEIIIEDDGDDSEDNTLLTKKTADSLYLSKEDADFYTKEEVNKMFEWQEYE